MTAVIVGAIALVVGIVVGRSSRRQPLPPGAPPAAAMPVTTRSRLAAVSRRRLPSFADVGGFEALKAEMRGSIGLLLDHPERAEEYRITWGGILLHGPPGCGKSFFARAIAGEFGCDLVPVDTADLTSGAQGEGARLVEEAFASADEPSRCPRPGVAPRWPPVPDHRASVAGPRGSRGHPRSAHVAHVTC